MKEITTNSKPSFIKSLGKLATAAVFAVGSLVLGTGLAQAAEEVNIKDGYAVHGYDVVAYFTDGAPTEGDSQYVAEYEGAEYRFANVDNLEAFKADPAKFAPQYGGYCAFGTAMGRKFDGDPHAWRIVDGKLFLNLNKDIQERWLADTDGFIRGADHNWPIIVNLSDSDLENNPPESLTAGAI